MATVKRFEREVGEALVVGVATDFDITGATVTARMSVNGATAATFTGALDAAVDGEITGAEVEIPGTTFSAAGYADGVLVITSEGSAWSPAKVRFTVSIAAVP